MGMRSTRSGITRGVWPPVIDQATHSVGVIVVDDQAAFRKAALAVIDAMSELHIVAEAVDAQGALAGAVTAPLPGLAIVDLHLGSNYGTDVCRQLRALRPELAVVLVSTTACEDLPSDVHTCGASGFISKSRFGIETLSKIVGLPHDLR